jgi:hypothetical protein
MIGWIARMTMFVSSIIVTGFVSHDSANLSLVEMAVSFLLIILLLLVGSFWSYLVAAVANRRPRAPFRARFDAEKIHPQIAQSETSGNTAPTDDGSEKLRR